MRLRPTNLHQNLSVEIESGREGNHEVSILARARSSNLASHPVTKRHEVVIALTAPLAGGNWLRRATSEPISLTSVRAVIFDVILEPML